MPVQYGIIGCGAIAQRRHIPEAEANPESNVAALADLNEGRVTALAKEIDARPYTDYKQMLEDPDLDAVVVCGPNALHAEQSIEALEAGKHVLCEKPMATTREDARRMIEAARKAGKYLMIGMNQRLMPPHVRAKEILDMGRVGRPIAFRTAFKHPGPEGWSIDGSKSWFFQKNAAFMGVTGDLGVHKADLMRWLLGEEFALVGGMIATLDKRDSQGNLIPLDDNAFLTLKTRSGVVGSMICSWTNYGPEENYTIIYCTRGQIAVGTDPVYGVIVEYRNGDREQHKVGQIATNEVQVASGVIDAMTQAIRTGQPPEIDGNEGYQALNVILTAMEAAQEGQFKQIAD